MQIDLRGKVILITGATGGIGDASSRFLARYGATIAVHYHRQAAAAQKLTRAIGNGSRAFKADLSRPVEAERLFRQVLGAYRRIHVLVNNAGIYEPSPMSGRLAHWLSGWDRTMMVNLTSAAVLCRSAIAHFLHHGGGRIIHVASRAALRGDTEDYLAYAAAKGGMVAVSKTIARAYGKHNILSFVIAPGYVRTRMTQAYIKAKGERAIVRELALNKITDPEDVAPIIVFLASGLMDHATGSTIDINAGSYIR